MSRYHLANWLLPIDTAPIEWGLLHESNGRILEVGPLSAFAPSIQETLRPLMPRLERSLLCPGFVNTHCHLDQSFGHSIEKSNTENFGDWLHKVITQLKSVPQDDASILQRCARGVAESLCYGTTCINDISASGLSLVTLKNEGLRGIVSLELIYPSEGTLEDDPRLIAWKTRFQKLKTYKCELLGLGFSPHSLYNVAPGVWRQLSEEFDKDMALIHSHLAESQDELDWLAQKPQNAISQLHQKVLGLSPSNKALCSQGPVEYLQHHKLFHNKSLWAHCIELDTKDWERLEAQQARIAHCPRSNLALHGKSLQARKLPPAIRLGLGTDGHLSTENLDLRAEARYAQELHAWSDETVLRHLCLEGAEVLGLASQIGSLSTGKSADMALWKSEAPVLNPRQAYREVLRPQSSLEASWVQGKQVFNSKLR